MNRLRLPEDPQVITAIEVLGMFHHAGLALARLDTFYIQSIIDRLEGFAYVARDTKHKALFHALSTALADWLDDRYK